MNIRIGKKWSLAILAMYFAACSDSSSSPTTSSLAMSGAPVVTNPQVMVGGMPVQGLVSRGTDQPGLFRIHVQAPGGLATIRRVVLQYSQPGPNHHGGSMMGGFSGTVLCYDDGTHGDDIPGDGIYHYMDPENQIGCHGLNAPQGNYQYAFWCEDMLGQRSNTATLTIVRQ
jgi:hypothetical protein